MPSPSLVRNLAAHARRHPSLPALLYDGETVTYGQLAERTTELASRLRTANLPADRPVCIPARKDPATVALMLAAFTESLVVLAPSAELGDDALDRICRQARVSARLSVAPGDDDPRIEPLTADETAAEGFARPRADRTRLLLTTSGSTGTPKLVPIGTDAFDAFAAWATAEFRITSGDTSLSYAPLNFDLALLDVWTFLGAGARVVLVDRAKATDGPHLRSLVSTAPVTFVQGVPLLHRLLTEGAGGSPFPQVREVVFTGDAMPQDLLRRCAESFPHARFHNVYGCTETNDSFVHPVDPHTAEGRIPIGRPLPGVEAGVLDDGGRPLTGPGTGELVVRTPFQTEGYLQQSLNPAVFTERTAADGERRVFYRTGDIVTRDADGVYTLEGRSDWQVKVRGVRTNLQEVESVLAQHPDVEEAAVVALPDAEAGVTLHARVTRRPGAALSSLKLRSYAGANLPRHAIPSTVRISELPLPRTSTGKPDRTKIKEEIGA
ncbi:class I adenylate-forming enzyme family protein [Streptomyces sp. NPDC004327]|uniref:class I adenylate-forming enzyme family protein n=1 Tax=unclassified Streptomyces TaxID=2593676 RepID=UPI00369A1600